MLNSRAGILESNHHPISGWTPLYKPVGVTVRREADALQVVGLELPKGRECTVHQPPGVFTRKKGGWVDGVGS